MSNLCPANLLGIFEQASQSKFAGRWAWSYLKNMDGFDILAKTCSKYVSLSYLIKIFSKVGTPKNAQGHDKQD